LAVAGTILFKSQTTNTNSQITNPEPQQTVNIPESTRVNQYSIQALRDRKYNGGEIEIVRKVRETGRFVSYEVTYDSDGLKQYALMNVPNGNKPATGWPVVIVNHGHIDPDVYSTENSYINTSAYFANAGFLVVKPDYRGHDKSEGTAEGIRSRVSYAVDVLNLLASLGSIEGADTALVFMYGHSMGGDVTLRVTEVTDKVKAASLWAPAVTDWPEAVLYFTRRNRSERLPTLEAQLEENFRREEYEAVSSFANTGLVKTPMNIQHSTTDESVPFSWGEKLRDKLLGNGVSVNYYAYPGDNHDIARNWATALARDVEFFRKFSE